MNSPPKEVSLIQKYLFSLDARNQMFSRSLNYVCDIPMNWW